MAFPKPATTPMSDTPADTVTQLLLDSTNGDGRATDALFPMIYDHLRSLARGMFLSPCSPQSLDPTELVHETYIKLAQSAQIGPLERTHFLNLAARAMRQILCDHATARRAAKRGGDWGRISLTSAGAASPPTVIDAIDLHDALEKLTQLDERKADVVTLRYLAGLSIEETADALGVSIRTVELDWRFARAWLRRQLGTEIEK